MSPCPLRKCHVHSPSSAKMRHKMPKEMVTISLSAMILLSAIPDTKKHILGKEVVSASILAKPRAELAKPPNVRSALIRASMSLLVSPMNVSRTFTAVELAMPATMCFPFDGVQSECPHR